MVFALIMFITGYNMLKDVLVTGAAGYIGSNICKQLKNRGYKVYALDLKYPKHKYYDDFIKINYGSRTIDLKLFMTGYNIKNVIHCAAQSLVGPSIQNPEIYYKNNVTELGRFLQTCKEVGVEDLVFISSAAVYYPSNTELNELSLTIPQNPYGRTKLIGEMMVQDSGLRYRNLRLFNVCGSDDGELGQEVDATHLISVAVMKKLEENKLIINGNNYKTNDGTCVRDYVHVVDIANAAIMSLENLNCTYMTMNVCSGNPMSNKQIADKVGVQYEYGLTRKGDPDTLFGSNALIKNILEWKPRYTLEQMIESTEKWYNDKIIM